MVFATVLPCAAESVGDYWQPCAEEKYSRAKMRRLRDRRVAVRHSQRKTLVLRQFMNNATAVSDLNAGAAESVPDTTTDFEKMASRDWESDATWECVWEYLVPETKVPLSDQSPPSVDEAKSILRRTLCSS